jgi:hypothetical protein
MRTKGLIDMNTFKSGLFAALTLAVLSQLAVGDDAVDAQRVCGVISSMGSTIACVVNETERAVDLAVTESVDDAAEFCSTFSGVVAMVTTTMSAGWSMRVFTPESSETPAAVCSLN